MTRAEARLLIPGVYRVHWKYDGGTSVASIGTDAHGVPWFAPANWLTVPWKDWRMVERVELIACP